MEGRLFISEQSTDGPFTISFSQIGNTFSDSPNHLREKIERIKTTLALSSSPQDQPLAHAAVEPVFWTKKTIANMQDAVNCMDLWGEKMALCHAFWLQFHQQNSFIDQLNQHMAANWHIISLIFSDLGWWGGLIIITWYIVNR